MASTEEDDLWPPASAPQASELHLIEGDIIVGERLVARGMGVHAANDTWKDGIVPYEIDSQLPAASRTQILDAIDRWNTAGGISLKPRAGMNLIEGRDYLRFQSGPGCASWVGRRGGEQAVWVAPTCSTGSMMHEIGHALGLEHEHTRPDRDQYIRILWENIHPDKRHNFDTTEFRSTALGAYDYASIMHYGPKFFSRNDQPTIQPLLETDAELGQRNAPSAGDIAAIAALYGTDLELVTQLTAEGGQTAIDLYVTNRSAQGAHDLEIVLTLGSQPLLWQEAGDWRCSRTRADLRCRLDRLAGDAASQLTVRIEGSLPEELLQARLRSVTPDTDLGNNGVNPSTPAVSLAPPLGSAIADETDSRALVGATLWMWGLIVPLLLWRVLWPRRANAQKATPA